jgi:hypothetical protein
VVDPEASERNRSRPARFIEPDMQICRIRLSDKTSRLHPRRAANKLGQARDCWTGIPSNWDGERNRCSGVGFGVRNPAPRSRVNQISSGRFHSGPGVPSVSRRRAFEPTRGVGLLLAREGLSQYHFLRRPLCSGGKLLGAV